MDDSIPAGPSARADTSHRFLFEQADLRGQCVNLQDSYRDIIAIHQYAPGVGRLLGEFLAASVLLSTTLKFEGKLILQARSQGQVPLLMAECNHELHIRGIARGAEEATALDNPQLLTQGQLAITIDPLNGQRYQGIVPLEAASLASSLDSYFEKSEQLGTRFWLAADGATASGMLLQQLPPELVPEEQDRQHQWENACLLAETLDSAELLSLAPQDYLHRLYHEDPVRLFAPKAVQFRCSCSRERTRNALASLDRAELRELVMDLGVISMDCEFCNQQYQFEKRDLDDLLGDGESKTLH